VYKVATVATVLYTVYRKFYRFPLQSPLLLVVNMKLSHRLLSAWDCSVSRALYLYDMYEFMLCYPFSQSSGPIDCGDTR